MCRDRVKARASWEVGRMGSWEIILCLICTGHVTQVFVTCRDYVFQGQMLFFRSRGLTNELVGLFFDGRHEVTVHDWGFEERVWDIMKR